MVNAAGPQVQELNRVLPGLRLTRPLTGFSRGVHLVTRQLDERFALALTTRKKTEGIVTRGGRHFFVIPWQGRSLIGTTNVPHRGPLDRLRVTARDVEEFLRDINETLPSIDLGPADVHFAYTGLYPLIAKEIRPDTYQGTGTYQLVDHLRRDGIEGIITALGAKYTTARRLAERCVDLAAQRLGPRRPCQTRSLPVPGGEAPDFAALLEDRVSRYGRLLGREAVAHLVRSHGSRMDAVVELGSREPGLFEPLAEGWPVLAVELVYAIRHEMAYTMADLLFRRTFLGTVRKPTPGLLDRIAAILRAELGLGEEELAAQRREVLERYCWR